MTQIEIFNAVRDIPYRIPLSEEEQDHTCMGKYELLKERLEVLGKKTRPRTTDFSWSDLPLPDYLREIERDDNPGHIYLEVYNGERWCIVDPTWDSGLERVLPVSYWDGRADTSIAWPTRRIHTPEESLREINEDDDPNYDPEEDLRKNGRFYEAFNNWLEDIRKGRYKK